MPASTETGTLSLGDSRHCSCGAEDVFSSAHMFASRPVSRRSSGDRSCVNASGSASRSTSKPAVSATGAVGSEEVIDVVLPGVSLDFRGSAAPSVSRSATVTVARAGVAADSSNSSSIDVPAPIVIIPPQMEHRARTPAVGTFDGSTRNIDRHSGHVTFTSPPSRSRMLVSS